MSATVAATRPQDGRTTAQHCTSITYNPTPAGARNTQDRAACEGQAGHQQPARTFTPVSKRPLGVSMMNEGGLNGYSGGSSMRPW